MKKTFVISILLSVCLLFAGCNEITNLEKIDVEQAKSIALAALEMSGTEVSYMEAELKERNGHKYYDIDLVVDGVKYEMDVDALTGVIIEKKIEDDAGEGTSVPTEEIDPEMNVYPYPLSPAADSTVVVENYTSAVDMTLAPAPIETEEPMGTFVPGNNTPVEPERVYLISSETAFEIACKYVGVSTGDVTLLYSSHNSSYNDDNPWTGELRREYDVYFRDASGMTYHVEVEAKEGEVLSMEKSMNESELCSPSHDADGKVTLPEGAISREQAIRNALNREGLNADQVIVVACEPDLDGDTYEYDVLFKLKDSSLYYGYEIKALSGKVIRGSRGVVRVGELNAEEAKATVLMQIKGAMTDDITAFVVETEYGKLIYRGTVVYSGMAYHFEVDGYSGAIRSWTVNPVNG